MLHMEQTALFSTVLLPAEWNSRTLFFPLIVCGCLLLLLSMAEGHKEEKYRLDRAQSSDKASIETTALPQRASDTTDVKHCSCFGGDIRRRQNNSYSLTCFGIEDVCVDR